MVETLTELLRPGGMISAEFSRQEAEGSADRVADVEHAPGDFRSAVIARAKRISEPRVQDLFVRFRTMKS